MSKTSNVKSSVESNLIWQGWRALHKSALLAGAEAEYFPPDYPELKRRTYLDRDVYVSLVSPLVSALNIDIEEYGSRADLIASLVWKRLRHKAMKEQFSVWSSITADKTAISLMRNLQEAGYAGRDLFGESDQPRELTIISGIAMKLVRSVNAGRFDLVSVLYGLALIGAIKLLIGQKGCALCFRRTWPGRKLCSEHSQSRTDKSDRSRVYMNYRIGRKAKQLAIERGQVEKLQGNAILRARENELAMADILFNSQHTPVLLEHDENCHVLEVEPSESGWDSNLVNASFHSSEVDRDILVFILGQKCPLTLRFIGGDSVLNYGYAELLKILRNKIDPFEWVDHAWGVKLFACELWLQLEAEVAPGERGLGKKSQLRIEKAIKLAGTGMSKAQIALSLGVSPSTISKWLDRNPELRGNI